MLLINITQKKGGVTVIFIVWMPLITLIISISTLTHLTVRSY